MVRAALPTIDAEPVGKVLQEPDSLRIDTGGGKVDHLGNPRNPIGAGGFDVGQVHIGPDMDPHRIGDSVHHLAHTEAPGTCPQFQHPHPYYEAGLGRYAGIEDRLVIVPLDIFHIQGNGMGMVLADPPGTRFRTAGIVMRQSATLGFHPFIHTPSHVTQAGHDQVNHPVCRKPVHMSGEPHPFTT